MLYFSHYHAVLRSNYVSCQLVVSGALVRKPQVKTGDCPSSRKTARVTLSWVEREIRGGDTSGDEFRLSITWGTIMLERYVSKVGKPQIPCPTSVLLSITCLREVDPGDSSFRSPNKNIWLRLEYVSSKYKGVRLFFLFFFVNWKTRGTPLCTIN